MHAFLCLYVHLCMHLLLVSVSGFMSAVRVLECRERQRDRERGGERERERREDWKRRLGTLRFRKPRARRKSASKVALTSRPVRLKMYVYVCVCVCACMCMCAYVSVCACALPCAHTWCVHMHASVRARAKHARVFAGLHARVVANLLFDTLARAPTMIATNNCTCALTCA